MTFIRPIARRLRHLFRRGESEAEMAEEMRFHLEQRAAEYAADGLPEAEARLAAQRRFGNTGSIQEHAREARGWGWLERLLKDLRFAVRQLIKSPSFTLLAVVTLGLGIGINTAMFNMLYSILMKPLPYPESAQLDRIFRATAQSPRGNVSPAEVLDLRREMADYGEIAAYTLADSSLSGPGQPAEMAPALRVSSNFFSILRIPPQFGRAFQRTEETPGNDRVVIISQRCWQNRFGGRRDVIGLTVRVDGEPHEIVGVLPATFNDWRHLGFVDLFRPLAWDRQQSADRRATVVRIIGRRSAQLSRAQAESFIANFGARLAVDFPEVNAGSVWRAVGLNGIVGGKSGGAILPMLVGLSGFVLLIACSNLANLLLARTIARAREFAVRAALGASRTQLLRPLIVESLLLALAGGLCAILFALWFGDWLAARSTGDNGEAVVLGLDWFVLGWALAASLVTAVAFGIAPTLFALRLNLNDTLKSGARGMTGGRNHQRFRQVLIVGQFALAMILLAGAGLFIRGLHDLNSRRSGWDSTHLVTGTILLPAGHYSNAEKITVFHRLTSERLAVLPGVTSVSISSFTPFFDWPDTRRYLVEGRELPEHGHEPAALVNTVSSRYFETVGTRLVSGRTFDERDTATSAKVFVLSLSTAKGLFGDESPVGRRLAQVGGETIQWGEIVGVVADVESVVSDPSPVPYQLYQSMAQEPRAQNEIAVRCLGVAPATLIDSIRAAIAKLDPDLPVRDLETADARIYRANYQLEVLRDMLSLFAVLGLALAGLGIYGVITRTMAQRTGEFAIRLALGATVGDITRMVLTSGVKLALFGSAFGLLGALGVSRLLAANFPTMQFDNLPVVIGATTFLVTVALVASYLPARRASRISPIEALRLE